MFSAVQAAPSFRLDAGIGHSLAPDANLVLDPRSKLLPS
jgi:hypothetical protein